MNLLDGIRDVVFMAETFTGLLDRSAAYGAAVNVRDAKIASPAFATRVLIMTLCRGGACARPASDAAGSPKL